MNNVSLAKKQVVNSFNNLSLDDKRNEVSKELMTIVSIINMYNQVLGLKEIPDAYNYQQKVDLDKPESEILTIYYADLINIESKLIEILSNYINH